MLLKTHLTLLRNNDAFPCPRVNTHTLFALFHFELADIDGDGSITVADIMAIVAIVMKG